MCQNDWASFGNYIGGIAAILNVWIFAYLSWIIYKADNNAKSRELLHRQSLVITQIRQDELRNLANVLNNATKVELLNMPFYNFNNARVYLLTFRDSYKMLFPILNEETFTAYIDEICNVLNRMKILSMNSAGFDKNGIKCEPIPLPIDEFNKLEQSFQDLKISILSSLEKDVLQSIEQVY